MFSIIKRKKPLHVRFFTEKDGVAELFPPQKLSRTIPEWWKKTERHLPVNDEIEKRFQQRTRNPMTRPEALRKSVKHCYAIQETFKHGIGFPMWCDAFVEVSHDDRTIGMGPGGSAPSGRSGLGEQHPREQYPGLLPDNYCNFKFNSVWVAYTEEYVPFWMCDPFYHKQNREWQGMNGVLEFYHQHNLNVNTILRKPPKPKKGQKETKIQYEFHAGDMLAYFIPMAHDRKIIVTAEQVGEKEWRRLHYQQSIWFAHAKEARKRNIGGCPINFRSK